MKQQTQTPQNATLRDEDLPESLRPSAALVEEAEEGVTKKYYSDKKSCSACLVSVSDIQNYPLTRMHVDHVVLPNDLSHIRYKNAYIFLLSGELFFIRDGQAEKVTIQDLEKFKSMLKKIMNTSDREYYIKPLQPNEVQELITNNGGHQPFPKATVTVSLSTSRDSVFAPLTAFSSSAHVSTPMPPRLSRSNNSSS
jgi:hypothetical protein